MSWLSVKVTEAAAPDASTQTLRYAVALSVEQSGGIEPELFVYRVSDDAFSHVATAYDLNVYPTSAAVARADGKDFYRRRDVALDYASKNTAVEARVHLQARLDRVNRQWQALGESTFGGVAYVTLDSGTL